MFRFFLALFAIVTSSLSANAQQLPSHQNLFTAFAVEPDSAIYADVGNAVRDFKEVCLAVYRAAVDNPDTRISQQDVDWPAGYETFTDRHKKRYGDVTAGIDINFNASLRVPKQVEKWEVNKLVTRYENTSVPGVSCSFNLSLSPGQTHPNLQTYIGRQWSAIAARQIPDEAMNYAMERINYSCDFSVIRKPTVRIQTPTAKSRSLIFAFPHEASTDTSELPVCQTKARRKKIQSDGYSVQSNGAVLGLDGTQIGRVSANGDIIDPHGKVIGRVRLSNSSN